MLLGALRARPRRRRALLRAVGSADGARRQAARARLAQAGDGPGGALAGHLAGGRLADRARRDGLRADRRAPRELEVGRIRDAMLLGPRPGGGAGLRLRGRLRRVRARQEGRPGLLPHHPPGRGRRAGSSATWTSRSRSPCSSRRRTRCAKRSTTTCRTSRKESGQLKVTHYDFDIDPLKAKEYGVSRQRHDRVRARHAPRAARPAPARSRARKTALRDAGQGGPAAPHADGQAAAHGRLHQGHGERNWEKPVNDTDKRPGIKTCATCWSTRTTTSATSAPPTGSCRTSPRTSPSSMVIGPAEAVPARGVGGAQPLHRPRRAAAHRARSREPRRHARGARSPSTSSTTTCTLANDQAFARRTAPGQRPRQPGDRRPTRRTRR